MPRKLKPCGTNAAYVRHIKNHEKPCRPCSDAHAAYNRGAYQLASVTPHRVIECGTKAGYRRHLRRREITCKACCAAVAKAHREYRARRRMAAAEVSA